MPSRSPAFESLCVKEQVHAPEVPPHVQPIHATSSFAFRDIEQSIRVFSGEEAGHKYSRYGNPTVDAAAAKIAALEGYGLEHEVAGLMTSSGMSAITTLLLAMLQKGDRVLTQANLYGGTTELLDKVCRRLGIEPVFADLHDLDEVDRLLRHDPHIRMCYFETPANPTLACLDIEALATLARQHGRCSAIDNTFATPFLQRPLALGVDFVVHSTTKYLNGHGTGIAGAIVGRKDLIEGPVWETMKLTGTNCSPFEAWLVLQGIKTLPLRMERHCHNARLLAQWLAAQPAVVRVNWPGLPDHPDHEIAKKQMTDFGAMLSFELAGGLEAGKQFMNRLRFCTLAPTLGDVDTLVLHPASSSHLNVPRALRLANGITDGLVRISVGIEAIDDLIADFAQAFEGL